MSDATYIELPPQHKKRPALLRSWRALLLLAVIAFVILAGCFSWWLAQGKVSSSYARVDTTVYTVEAAYPTTVEQMLIRDGDEVAAGQPLARIDTRALAASLQPRQQPQQQDAISGRLNEAQSQERKMAARVAQARAEEERYQKIHQQRVTEHVRAQLAMRAREGRADWDAASRAEAAARARMDAARDDFERVSRMRAALDMELGKIRMELARRKRLRAPAQAPAPAPAAQAAMHIDNTLYAPAQGKVISVNVRPGEPVDRGQAIFVILPSGPEPNKWVQAWFPQADVQLLAEGQTALIHAENVTVRGTVGAIARDPQALQLEGGGSGLFISARVNVDNQEELAKLAPGTRVDCQIQTRYLLGETFFF